MEKIKPPKSPHVTVEKAALDKIRRRNLAEFFDGGYLPPNEKSYISQLIKGKASFGERAARRLEQTYNMGAGYLDRDSSAGDNPRQGNPLDVSSMATLAVSIIQSTLMMAGLTKNFLGEEAELRTAIMQRKSNRSRSVTPDQIREAFVKMWVEDGDAIASLAQARGGGGESVEEARRRIGEKVAATLLSKVKEI